MLVLCTKEKESGRREKGKRRRNDGRERGNDAKQRVFCFVFCFFSEKNHNLPTAEASSNLTKDIGC